MEKGRRSTATDEQVKLVRKAMRDLGEKHTVEVEALQRVRKNSIVVLEFLGDHPQTKRIQIVEDKKGLAVEGVDMLVDETSLVYQKILGRTMDGENIAIKDNVVVKILEIIDSDPPKSSEPQQHP